MTDPRRLSQIIKIVRGETPAGKRWAKLSDHDMDMVELGVRRLVSLGYRLVGPTEFDPETVEQCAQIAEVHEIRGDIGAAIREFFNRKQRHET